MAASRQRRTKPKSKSVAKPSQVKVPPRSGGQRPPLPPKLSPPRPGRLYPRERLFELLDRMRRDHRVIWVSAPGGAGKTSLATSYLTARKLPTLWYQVDQGDGDIASFFYYIGLAAQRAAPRFKKPLPVLSPEYLADIPTFTRNFFREFYRRMPRNGVFVLDNYQDAPEETLLHDVLHTAMSEVPEGIHLIVLSRIEPPAVLARLRLCDHAACLDWNKMQLTPDETVGISAIRTGEAVLDRKTMETLHERAQGWVAGMVLILEQSRSGEALDLTKLPTGQKLLFNYFAGEHLSRSDPREQDFLVRTCLFPKISIPAAAELTGNDRAPSILDDLTRRNYFTVRHPGPEHDTYEYHPLFREFLLGELARRYDATSLRALRARAAELLESSGDIDAAIFLRQEMGDWEKAGNLIATHARSLLGKGRAQLLLQWLGKMPPAAKDQSPWLLYWEGMSQLAFGPTNARASLGNAFHRFKDGRDAVGAYVAWCALIDTYIYEWSNFTPIGSWIDEFERLSVDLPLPADPRIEAQVACAMFLALLYIKPWHEDMSKWAERVSVLVHQDSDEALRAKMCPHLLIYLTWWRMDIRRCELLLDTMRPLMEKSGSDPLTQTTWYTMLAGFYWMTGENDKCLNAVHRGFEIANRSGVHVWDVLMACQGIFGALSSGRLPVADTFFQIIESRLGANRLMDQAMYMYLSAWRFMLVDDIANAEVRIRRGSKLVEEAGWYYGAAIYRNDLGRVLFYKGDREAAIALVQQSRTEARSMGSHSLAYVTALVDAERAYVTGDEDGCLRSMREFLSLGREHGLYNHTWWDARMMSRLYAKALAHDIETDYVRAVIKKRELSPPENEAVPESWPFPLKLYTLGRFSVVIADKPHARSPSHKKPLELLQALITLGGRDVDENDLAETLWPGIEGDAARRNLKVNIHRLRKLLPQETIVWSEGKLSLNARRVWVDLWVLDRELTRLDQISSATPTSESQSLLDRIFNLYHGEFLLGNTASWVLTVRERLRNKALRIMTRAAESISQRDSAAAVPIYERAIELDPLREALYQGLIRCYQKLQQPAEGMRIYQRCRETLKHELGVSPSPTTEALHQALKTSTY